MTAGVGERSCGDESNSVALVEEVTLDLEVVRE